MSEPVGRPLKYKTAEEMQAGIDEYFELCQPKYATDADGNVLKDNRGNPITELNPPTITGLALHLGFCNRSAMYDYEARGEFCHAVKTARSRCENWVEVNGLQGNTPPAMAIFALKNYGWSDKQEIEHSGNADKPLQIIVNGVKPIEH